MTTRALALKSEPMKVTMASRVEPGIVDLLRLEYLKTSKRLMTRVIFGLMFGGFAMLFGLAYFTGIVLGMNDSATVSDFLMPKTLEDGFANIAFLGPILTVVLAAGIAGSEFSWGTVRTVTAAGVSRSKLLAAKLVVIIAASTLLVLAGQAAIGITSTGISLIERQGLSLGWLDVSAVGDLLLMTARTSFILAFYGVLGFAVSQISRSLAAGIAIGLGVLMIEPILTLLVGSLGSFGEYADDFSLSHNVEVIASLNTFGTPDAMTGAPDPWQSALLLTLYAALAVIGAVAHFRRRDIAVD